MTINSIYLFLENHGNILRDYYLNNTLTYSNTITDEWVYDSNLNRISFKFKPNSINYFHKSLTENYNESFSIFFHLKIDNLSLYQDENTDYFIFDSINPDGSNQLKSFAIVLQKISNKYFYKLKIDNLNNGNQYLDIYEIDNSINNINQQRRLRGKWMSDGLQNVPELSSMSGGGTSNFALFSMAVQFMLIVQM